MARAKDAGTLLAPVGIGVLAIVCCAGLPVLAGVFAGVTLATILGLGGGLIALIAVLSVMVLALRARRRRRCPPTRQRPTT
jgi:uncharacterized membrane protein YedE/YeeE